MQFRIADLHGQPLALLMWYLDENQDQRAAILSGTIFIEKNTATLNRGDLLPPFPLRLMMLRRVIKVPEDLKDIFRQAPWCLQITAGDLPVHRREENFSALLANYH